MFKMLVINSERFNLRGNAARSVFLLWNCASLLRKKFPLENEGTQL